MQGKRNSNFDALIVGFALFAMFFGAGNLVFPPSLGLNSGSSWVLGFFSYFIADVGLATMGVFALMKCDGDLEILTKPLGVLPGRILITAVILCIGPFLAIPRTAATTFEIGIAPLLGLDGGAKVALAIFSVIYFVVVLALCLKPSKVVDIIGKFLTPVLVVFLLILIGIGVVAPKGEIAAPVVKNVVKSGILDGYNTMDAMGSVLLAGIVIAAIYGKGYKKGKVANIVVAKSAIVSGVMLCVIYGGLTYLGATTGANFADKVGNKGEFLVLIVRELMGYAGVVVIAVAVLMACLTTAIGLTTIAGDYFSDISEGKLKYQTVVIAVAAFSAVATNLGLAKIINLAVPILVLVYPIIIFIIIAAFLQGTIKNANAYRFTAFVVLVVSIMTILADGLLGAFWFKGYEFADMFTIKGLAFVHQLPFDSYGFNWLLPAIVAMIIGLFIPGPSLDSIVIEPKPMPKVEE